jgi:hypothetical protein
MSNHGRPATENTRLEILAPETWTVEGTEIKEVASYYMILEAGLQYTVEIVRTPKSAVTVDEEAWPFIKYAFESKRYLRARIDAYGQKGVSATRIGVRFRTHRFEQRQDDPTFVLGISEVRRRIAEEVSSQEADRMRAVEQGVAPDDRSPSAPARR